ncbi:TolC family protein [Derxia gummosa]|uniref:TolC family protein n=1 Tax=Derxia gummosa DSM 723 TaxID=1121388 RepID=A0A8B6X847_9BURK|nr:TolC family protein [Derxia gummosa]
MTTATLATPSRAAAARASTAARGLRLLPIAAAIALVSGCAVTPRPLDRDALRSAAAEEHAALVSGQQAPDAPVTLEEAFARTVKYNLDYRVKLMEEALGQRQLDLASLDLLPKVVAGAGYTARSNDLASSSVDAVTGRQSLVPSYSSERTRINADLGLSWNVLDFGVSWYSAQQQADRALILQERRRRVAHQVVQQTRQLWWQALAAQRLEAPIDALLRKANAALADSRAVENERLRPVLETLAYQRQLLDVIRQLTQIRGNLAQAKPRLAALMNLTPGQKFDIAPPASLAVPELGVALDKAEEFALANRPELVEARYNERIGVAETRKAVAKLLPGLELSIGDHYDSNRYLVNQGWADAGLRVSWNLLNVFNHKTIRGAADAQLAVAREQKVALGMAVLTQVHVAWADYDAKRRQFELESELANVEQRILGQTENAVEANAQAKLQSILAGANAVLSQLRQYQTYGDLQNAYGQIGASLGIDAFPNEAAGQDVASLAQAFAGAESRWQARLAGTETK